MTLTEKTGGAAYGETALPVDEKIESMFPQLKAGNKPTIVWLCDVSDDKILKKIDGTIMKNEGVGIAMQRFNTFRVNVLDMPDGELKDKYMKRLPAFHFYDPAAKPLKAIAGKRAASLSMFTKLMEATWNQSFVMTLKDFQKGMKDVLDGLDKYEVKKQVVDKKRERLEEKPNRGVQRQVDAEQAKLDEMRKEIEEQEKALVDKCALRPDFLPEAAGEESR